MNERGLDGPKYPIYSGATGISRLFGRIHKVSSGVVFLYNDSSRSFQEHIGLNPGKEIIKASRFIWFVGHEYLFGHVGFVTDLGLYLNNYYNRRSLVATKIGFNFYLKNSLEKTKYMPWIGFSIHSNLTEAEFVELILGYSF